MNRRLIVLLSALAATGAATAALASRTPPQAVARAVPTGEVTVVELFTSQGCSSCPPANANLRALAPRPDVLALSWGVTYWDQLGWKDTFASDAYTRRQRDYQRGLGTDNVWTPQIVVDGRRHVVGQRMAQIEGLIAQHTPFTGPEIVFRNGAVGLAGGSAPRAAAVPHIDGPDKPHVRVSFAIGTTSHSVFAIDAAAARKLAELLNKSAAIVDKANSAGFQEFTERTEK